MTFDKAPTRARFTIALALSMLSAAGAALAAGKNPGPTNFPDPASPKDGQILEFQLLTETMCVNGHFAGEAAPGIAVIPPSLRSPDDHGAPGYRIFISCPQGYLRTAIWNPATNKVDAGAPAVTK